MARSKTKAPPPPLVFETLDSFSIGDTMYERRQLSSGVEGIYVYSNKFKTWYPYSRTYVNERWNKLKGNMTNG